MSTKAVFVAAAAALFIAGCASSNAPHARGQNPTYSIACARTTTSYKVFLVAAAGNGRWTDMQGKQIAAKVTLYNGTATGEQSCSNASGAAILEGKFPAVLRLILAGMPQGTWRAANDSINVTFGDVNAWVTLHLPMAGGTGSYQGLTAAEGAYPAASGQGQVIPR